MNQSLTSKERSIVTGLLVVLGLALLSSMTSCTGTRPMTSCDYIKTHFGGYK